jgi:hypothetical protein
MKTKQFALKIIGQLKDVIEDSAIEQVVDASLKELKSGDFSLKELESRLEEVSPLEVDSMQWRNLKYTLIYLRKQEVLQSVEA